MLTDRQDRGATLMELLMALAAGTLVVGACFSLGLSFQKNLAFLQHLLERDLNRWPVPVLVDGWVSAAGCGLPGRSAESCDLQPNTLSVLADLDGAGGFPDRRLDSAFESLGLLARGRSLRLSSGGSGYQPVLEHVDEIRFAWVAEGLLRVEVETSVPRDSLIPWEARRRDSVDLLLWNLAESDQDGENPP